MNTSRKNRVTARAAVWLLLILGFLVLGAGYSHYVMGGMGMGHMGGMGMMHHGSQSSGDTGSAGQDASSGDPAARVYASSCSMCHAHGLAGAPAYGDKTAWAPRIAQGSKVLYDHALHGYRAMPPKGGHMDLSDAQVEATVDYMVMAAGGWGNK